MTQHPEEFYTRRGSLYRAFYDAGEGCWYVDEYAYDKWFPKWCFPAEDVTEWPGLVFGRGSK